MYKIIDSKLNNDNTTDLTLQHDDGSKVIFMGCYPIGIKYPKDDRSEPYNPDKIPHIKLEYQYWIGEE